MFLRAFRYVMCVRSWVLLFVRLWALSLVRWFVRGLFCSFVVLFFFFCSALLCSAPLLAGLLAWLASLRKLI